MRTLALLLLVGCVTAPAARSTDEARSSLLAAHATERQTHLARDAHRIGGSPWRLRAARRGEIRILSVEEQRHHFAKYFAAVTFDRWDERERRPGGWRLVALASTREPSPPR